MRRCNFVDRFLHGLSGQAVKNRHKPGHTAHFQNLFDTFIIMLLANKRKQPAGTICTPVFLHQSRSTSVQGHTYNILPCAQRLMRNILQHAINNAFLCQAIKVRYATSYTAMKNKYIALNGQLGAAGKVIIRNRISFFQCDVIRRAIVFTCHTLIFFKWIISSYAHFICPIIECWKSHATLTLLAKQDCPLWLQYD